MKIYYILTTVLIWLAVPSFGQLKEKAAIDKIFAQWNQTGVPGGSVGVIQNGKLIYAQGYGMTNLEHGIPNSPKSVFRIGSTSKRFAAACIVLLSEQGKLSLKHTLRKFYPKFPAYAHKITVQHLLHHTSGLRDYLALIPLKGLKEHESYTDEQVMPWLVKQKELNFSPGEAFSYSNSGYWLLGQIVKKVSGMDLADFARKEIFEPLGMNHTHFHNDHTQIVKNRASGYAPKQGGGYKISMTNSDLIGDGGLFTTIEDLKKWDDAFYESKVLSKKFWRTMIQSGVLNNGEEVRYGGGLFLETYKGLKALTHGGSSPGFRAEMIRFPQQRFSVVVLANRADADPTSMAYQIADIFLQNKFPQRKQEKKAKVFTPVKYIKLSTQKLKQYEGRYWHAKSASFRKIYLKNDTLRYQRSATNENSLVPVGANEFKMLNVGGNVIVKFEKANQGKHLMKFVVDGRTSATFKSYQPKSYTTKALQKFAGNYYSTELGVAYKLTPKDKKLTLFINDRELLSVKPVMEHLFLNLPDPRNGTLKFQTNEDGKVNGFLLSFWGAKNVRFVKQ